MPLPADSPLSRGFWLRDQNRHADSHCDPDHAAGGATGTLDFSRSASLAAQDALAVLRKQLQEQSNEVTTAVAEAVAAARATVSPNSRNFRYSAASEQPGSNARMDFARSRGSRRPQCSDVMDPNVLGGFASEHPNDVTRVAEQPGKLDGLLAMADGAKQDQETQARELRKQNARDILPRFGSPALAHLRRWEQDAASESSSAAGGLAGSERLLAHVRRGVTSKTTITTTTYPSSHSRAQTPPRQTQEASSRPRSPVSLTEGRQSVSPIQGRRAVTPPREVSPKWRS